VVHCINNRSNSDSCSIDIARCIAVDIPVAFGVAGSGGESAAGAASIIGCLSRARGFPDSVLRTESGRSDHAHLYVAVHHQCRRVCRDLLSDWVERAIVGLAWWSAGEAAYRGRFA
jgi:hypothetical protein